jgi:glutaredoxin-related protein
MDVEGQEKRINMNEKVAPVVFNRSGKPKPPTSDVLRKAREIVEKSGANSEERFNRVVLGESTFRDQAKTYLNWVQTRDREPIKDASSIEAALNKWILPEIGELPLADVHNITVKPLVDNMKKSLSARTVKQVRGIYRTNRRLAQGRQNRRARSSTEVGQVGDGRSDCQSEATTPPCVSAGCNQYPCVR